MTKENVRFSKRCRERSCGKKHQHQLEFFVSWKCMRHAHSGWRSDSELTDAAEVVQHQLDTHGQWTTGQDRPAAGVGRSRQ